MKAGRIERFPRSREAERFPMLRRAGFRSDEPFAATVAQVLSELSAGWPVFRSPPTASSGVSTYFALALPV